ncbi:DNAJ protein Caj1/Djp1-type [Schizosaccharomyces japonicus yFS275]|uniref:DNAJ protein Caj1/Djp1-type n=1 Tax=Schizosaccharomyces japonicus (strain yFS275 / FY16936) TaxID=402676 RepID=B6JZJ4_SCHJY|nr:DNAJ protein Caj1/Djp1-type [Schizosaccharomyces japonicus yFS275]EEB06962.2 DNAJ protein Caj1/Djp1-type [Schizosaccharomyces japonicus yFS275]
MATTTVDKEYYEILGVAIDADELTIKKAYRKLAIQYHPDKNRENPEEAKAQFQKIGEAYQVLGDPELRKKYDTYGKEGAVPEMGFQDAQLFFENLFGGESFKDYIGEITLLKELIKMMGDEADEKTKRAVEDTEESKKVLQKQQDETRNQEMEVRIEKLARYLTDKLSVWTETDKDEGVTEAFKMKMTLEAENLKMASFGAEMLHAIGGIYIQKANNFIRSLRYYMAGSIWGALCEKGTVIKDTWYTIRSALDAHTAAESIAKAESEQENMTEAEMAELQKNMTGKVLAASWRGARFEIQHVLRQVCDKVLYDKTVPKEKRKDRAQALLIVGDIFSKVEPDKDSETRFLETLVEEHMSS